MASTPSRFKARIKTVKNTKQIVAYIDGANLYSGAQKDGWLVDYPRFMTWLREKHKVTKAYLFIGMIASNGDLYRSLQEAGFILVFKPTVMDPNGKVKGNCDADMVLKIVADSYENKFDQAVLITSDGDFYSTVEFLLKKDQLSALLSPARNCSILLKRTAAKITNLRDVKSHIEYNKPKGHKKMRPPLKTKHQKGSHRSDSTETVAKKSPKVKGKSK